MRAILFLLTLLALPLNALEIKRVILATNNNPDYIEFWPVVAPMWKKMGFTPTLALIAYEGCPIDTSIGDVIRFDPIPGVSEALQAQVVRLLLPALFPDDGCIISDIDMLPLSKTYFVEGAASCPDDTFLVYRNKAPGYAHGGKYPMCYLAGKGRVFGSIFGISTYDQIGDMIRLLARAKLGWYTDELMIYAQARKWETTGGKILCLNHGVGPRLDRIHWNMDFKNLDISKYIDCHCPRPYSAHRESIDRVVEAFYKMK
ncbi:MAG: hypothetical protein HYX48_00915 [Chlamydiales bacterium]|nr:hypothetical protein [Chlamydiales bacterium]